MIDFAKDTNPENLRKRFKEAIKSGFKDYFDENDEITGLYFLTSNPDFVYTQIKGVKFEPRNPDAEEILNLVDNGLWKYLWGPNYRITIHANCNITATMLDENNQ